MRIDLTIGVWSIVAFGGVVCAFLINQWFILRTLQTWVRNHEKVAHEAIKVLEGLTMDMVRISTTLDEHERRLGRLEQ